MDTLPLPVHSNAFAQFSPNALSDPPVIPSLHLCVGLLQQSARLRNCHYEQFLSIPDPIPDEQSAATNCSAGIMLLGQVDKGGLEEIFHAPAEQTTILVPSVDQGVIQSSSQDGGFRSLIDLSPIQPQRDIQTLRPTLIGSVEGNQKKSSETFQRLC